MSLRRFPRQLFLLDPSDTAFKEIRVASSAFRCQFFSHFKFHEEGSFAGLVYVLVERIENSGFLLAHKNKQTV